MDLTQELVSGCQGELTPVYVRSAGLFLYTTFAMVALNKQLSLKQYGHNSTSEKVESSSIIDSLVLVG